MEEKLINLWQEHECLYNVNDNSYYNYCAHFLHVHDCFICHASPSNKARVSVIGQT